MYCLFTKYFFHHFRYGSDSFASSPESDLDMDRVPMLGAQDEFEMDETEYLMRSGARGNRRGGLCVYLTEAWSSFCNG